MGMEGNGKWTTPTGKKNNKYKRGYRLLSPLVLPSIQSVADLPQILFYFNCEK